MKRTLHATVFCAIPALLVLQALAQAPPPPPELDRLVARIALYPDPLLSQVLAASTYYNDIPDAARWADEHHYLAGPALANAIQADRLPWDPSVQALLPFPSVLDMMASDMGWTSEVGNAFLMEPDAVMDAVQRERRRAWQYGYLRSNPQIVVTGGPYLTIMPANPAFVPVPYYDSAVVFYAPRPGFFVGGAIRFGFGVTLGGFFRPWGWGYNRFDWDRHVVVINNAPWRRTWAVRTTYVHPYTVQRYAGPRAPEHHELEGWSPREREAVRHGERFEEEHHDRGEHRGWDDHHDKGQHRGRRSLGSGKPATISSRRVYEYFAA